MTKPSLLKQLLGLDEITRPDVGPTATSDLTAVERIVTNAAKRLCARLKVEFGGVRDMNMWAHIGVKLAIKEPEFKFRKRGAPKGSRVTEADKEIYYAIEKAMRDKNIDFDAALNQVLKANRRPSHISDRTTYPKRFRRLKARLDEAKKHVVERDKKSK
jgi:hypothetical protein